MQNKLFVLFCILFYVGSIATTYYLTKYYCSAIPEVVPIYVPGKPSITIVEGKTDSTKTETNLHKTILPNTLAAVVPDSGVVTSTPTPFIWDSTSVDDCGKTNLKVTVFGKFDSLKIDMKRECIKTFRVDSIFIKTVDTLKFYIPIEEKKSWYDNFVTGAIAGVSVVVSIILITGD